MIDLPGAQPGDFGHHYDFTRHAEIAQAPFPDRGVNFVQSQAAFIRYGHERFTFLFVGG